MVGGLLLFNMGFDHGYEAEVIASFSCSLSQNLHGNGCRWVVIPGARSRNLNNSASACSGVSLDVSMARRALMGTEFSPTVNSESWTFGRLSVGVDLSVLSSRAGRPVLPSVGLSASSLARISLPRCTTPAGMPASLATWMP